MRSIESPIRYFLLLLSLCLFTSTALNAEASLFLTHSSPSPLPGGLLSTTFSVSSTSGEIINSFVNPSLTTFFGPGLHQVWPPFFNSATPTRENQLSLEPLWSDTWLPYDTYFFFTNDNSLHDRGLIETKAGSGATLPSAGFGPPSTGFGDITPPSLGARYELLDSSGLQGTSVPFVQVVYSLEEYFKLSVTVGTTTGTQSDLQFSYPPCICGLTVVPDNIQNVNASVPGFLNHYFYVNADLPDPSIPVTMSDFKLDSYYPAPGSSGTSPAIPATFDAATRTMHWNTVGSPLGSYYWGLTASSQGYASRGDFLVVITAVPEPSSLLLLGISGIGLLGSRKLRRSEATCSRF